MQGFVGRRDILTPRQLQAFSARSNLSGTLQLGSHVAALACSAALLAITWNTWLAVPAFLMHGVILNWLYCGQHELSHGTVFRSKRANEIVGRIIGFIQLYPRDFDRIQHFAHHRHTGDWQKDPELQRRPFTLGGYVAWFAGITYWRARLGRLWRFSLGNPVESYISEDEKPLVIREARAHVALYALVLGSSLLFSSWAVVLYWLAPMMLTKWAYMLQGTIKHLGRPHNDSLFDNTRTARAGRLFRWLGWNMQFHTAHHLFPSVPFHRLPKLHRTIVEKLGDEPPTMGYFAFQKEVFRKLMRGREGTDYRDDDAWIASIGDAAEHGARRGAGA